jgi:SAM-dependent methyltransferase
MADLATPMAIRVAATLRIADHIAAGSTTAGALAGASDCDEQTLDRLLRHLVTLGLLARSAAGDYSLTELGTELRDDHPLRARSWLDIDGGVGRAELAWVQLLHSVRTGEAAFPALYGRDFWDELSTDEQRSAAYDDEMAADVAAWAPAILDGFDWGALEHVVDVGGGNGTLLVELLRAHPQLKGTVVELPRSVVAARTTFEAAGVADRTDVVAGSFFEPLPPDLGAYVLTAIVHDWGDDDARIIVRRCAEAAGAGGRVFVIEKIGSDGAVPNTAMDLRLLVYMGGRERDLGQLTALVESAGCRLVAVHPAGAIQILELIPET